MSDRTQIREIRCQVEFALRLSLTRLCVAGLPGPVPRGAGSDLSTRGPDGTSPSGDCTSAPCREPCRELCRENRVNDQEPAGADCPRGRGMRYDEVRDKGGAAWACPSGGGWELRRDRSRRIPPRTVPRRRRRCPQGEGRRDRPDLSPMWEPPGPVPWGPPHGGVRGASVPHQPLSRRLRTAALQRNACTQSPGSSQTHWRADVPGRRDAEEIDSEAAAKLKFDLT